MNDISTRYFEWLCDIVTSGRRFQKLQYSKLLQFLHSVDFTYILDRDGNRYEDGIDMRYRFGETINEASQRMIGLALDSKPCSMLEMMVGLSCRCEEQIMSNSSYGNRTGNWFWSMVESLGLSWATNNKFDNAKCCRIINRFLNREYEPTGHGGLFSVEVIDDNGNVVDLTTQEIWFQAMWYLNYILEGGTNE